MSERSNNIKFYLSSTEFGREDLSPDGIKDFKDLPGDNYGLEERGYFSVKKLSKVVMLQKGYEYLLGVLLSTGPSTKVRFTVEEKDDKNIEANWVRTSDTYVDMYTLSFDDENDNRSVSCSLISGGDLKVMESSFSDDFDVVGVGVPELPYVQVRYDPRLIFRRSELTYLEGFVMRVPASRNGKFKTVPLTTNFVSDQNISGTSFIDVFQLGDSDNLPGGFFYFTADRDRTIRVKGSAVLRLVDFSRNLTNSVAQVLLETYENGESLNTVPDLSRVALTTETLAGNPNLKTWSFDFDYTIDVMEGQSLTFAIRHASTVGEDYLDLDFEEILFQVSEDSTFPATTSKAVKPADMFQHLGGIILGDPNYAFVSSLFGPGGKHENKLLVHGTWLRNMPPILNEGEADERRIQANLSMETLFDGYSLLEPLRYDVTSLKGKDVFNVDSFKLIQQNFTGVRIGSSMPDFKLTKVSAKGRDVLGENYYRKIKIGSETSGSNYGEVNNLYSISGYCEWSSPHTDSEGEYEAVSEMRTGAEDFELQRQLQYENDPDLDAERDEDWFLLDAEWNGVEYVVRGWERYYEEIPTGVYSAESNYNWPFGPAELLRGHGFKVNAGLEVVSNQSLKNPTGNCNLSIRTKRVGENHITSNEPFPISFLDKPKILPFMLNSEFPMNDEIREQLRGTTRGVDNKFGLVEIDYGGEIIKGRLYDITTDEIAKLKIIQAKI